MQPLMSNKKGHELNQDEMNAQLIDSDFSDSPSVALAGPPLGVSHQARQSSSLLPLRCAQLLGSNNTRSWVPLRPPSVRAPANGPGVCIPVLDQTAKKTLRYIYANLLTRSHGGRHVETKRESERDSTREALVET